MGLPACPQTVSRLIAIDSQAQRNRVRQSDKNFIEDRFLKKCKENAYHLCRAAYTASGG